jgi:hypothetical protein
VETLIKGETSDTSHLSPIYNYPPRYEKTLTYPPNLSDSLTYDLFGCNLSKLSFAPKLRRFRLAENDVVLPKKFFFFFFFEKKKEIKKRGGEGVAGATPCPKNRGGRTTPYRPGWGHPISAEATPSDASQGAGHANHTHGNGAEFAQDPLSLPCGPITSGAEFGQDPLSLPSGPIIRLSLILLD